MVIQNFVKYDIDHIYCQVKWFYPMVIVLNCGDVIGSQIVNRETSSLVFDALLKTHWPKKHKIFRIIHVLAHKANSSLPGIAHCTAHNK